MSSSYPERTDFHGQSRTGKRKAASESEGDELPETPALSPRSAKRPAVAKETFEDIVSERSRPVLERDHPVAARWYNNPSSRENERGIAGANSPSDPPFIPADPSTNPMVSYLSPSPFREPTLASLLRRSEAALLPSMLDAATGFSSAINPQLYSTFASLGATTDSYRHDIGNLPMPMTQGRDLLLAQQRSQNQPIAGPSSIFRFADSKESSPVPTIASGFDSYKAAMGWHSLTHPENSVNYAQDILNRQRYATAIAALRSTQEPRTLRDILTGPAESMATATASPFRQHSASSNTSTIPSWVQQNYASLPASSALTELLTLSSSRRDPLATASAFTTPNYPMLGELYPSRRFGFSPRLLPSDLRSTLESALGYTGPLSQQLPSYSSAAAASAPSLWPSVSTEVEALAASFAQQESEARRQQSVGTGIPTSLPASLSIPDDSLVLSELQVCIRQQIEVFCASEEDILTHKRGRNKPITVGQVGIRCRHCAHVPTRHRQAGATYFPSTLIGIYQVAQNMAKFHFQSGICREMPVNTQNHLNALVAAKKSSVTSGVGRQYWAESAKSIGLVDSEDSGIRFIRDL